MEKFVYYNELFLIYKNFLTDSNKEIFDLYYGDNLSMQEIADIKNVTRSRIGAIIKQVEKKLDNLEDNCHLYEINTKLKSVLELNDIKEMKKEIEIILKGE